MYAGTAAVAIALTTADIRAHSAALRHASRVHADNIHQLHALQAEDERARAYLADQLRPWIRDAKQREAQLQAALDAHAAANAAWRDAAGRLLAEARAAGDHHAAQRVAGLNDAYTRVPATP